MVEIYTQQLAGIEVLHAVPAGQKQNALPTVLFYHGFTSSKLVYSYFAVALAQAGMRVVMPDAQGHGARFNGDENARLQQFWPILKTSIDEFAQLRQALMDQKLIREGKFAVGGASMGGMTALGIMARHQEVRCVACLMGSGYFSTLAKTLFPPQEQQFDEILAMIAEYDISHQLERIGDRPLLLWHGEEDDVVPAVETWRLQQALIQQGLDKHLTCLREAGVKHRITPPALDAAAQFFAQHL
ncbi:esterase [Enterobacteriaceae bacterium H20N1]|uniref:Esterase n=1 Tax=Dryocola boscaweniae TaxID=2925397 RepID=A0A9X2WA54_9ENTR|nr:esterase [Dryocola boscaweniae]MCT4703047.1 esterase [Dryocola boscaweniae]MCT4715180.1 esterase [Dryocola boscaweniae]MCT4720215.1 esterase [Dryocola boscaweniae]